MESKSKPFKLFYTVLVGALLLFACTGGQSNKKDGAIVKVFAAASLTEVIGEIADSFEVSTGITVKISLASSGTLARQIEQGEIPNIFLSANVKWTNYIDSLGYIAQPYKTELAYNSLVFIVPIDSKLNMLDIKQLTGLDALIGDGRLSIGDPRHVPAGKYAMQALKYYNWDGSLTNKILPAKDVRSALMVVELAESPLGIVYATDAIKSKKVKIAGYFPEESHSKITYIAGVCKETKEAVHFYQFMQSEISKSILAGYGFKNE